MNSFSIYCNPIARPFNGLLIKYIFSDIENKGSAIGVMWPQWDMHIPAGAPVAFAMNCIQVSGSMNHLRFRDL